MVIEKFTAAGYVYIGMDHFAKSDDELCVAQREKTLYRNFRVTQQRPGVTCTVLVTSISMVGNCYAQNRKELSDYYLLSMPEYMATHRDMS